jgi:predicted enzyme related to lactoylglutathione lyase
MIVRRPSSEEGRTMPRVVHFEIHAAEPEKAIAFYQAVFAWQFQKWAGPVDYWLIRTGPESERGIDGGMVRRQGAIDGTAVIAYVCTVQVEALDATVKAIEAAGGSIVLPKMAIPGVGWLAYAKDTQGNIFGVMQPDAAAR